ncbi:MAG TPA: hypothetical protein VFZ91_12130 [Allosphingosinicella sp.]
MVTADRRIVVANSWKSGDRTAISAASWDGSRWAAFGEDLPFPARSPSFGSGQGVPSVAAFLNGRFPEVRHWNGFNWSAPDRPCVPPRGKRNFGPPSLAIRTTRITVARFALADQLMLACALGRFNREERTLVARIKMPSGSWAELGTGTINGATPLAEGSHLAFIMRADWRGQPWVAWSARGEDGLSVRVSTLVPLDGPNP